MNGDLMNCGMKTPTLPHKQSFCMRKVQGGQEGSEWQGWLTGWSHWCSLGGEFEKLKIAFKPST